MPPQTPFPRALRPDTLPLPTSSQDLFGSRSPREGLYALQGLTSTPAHAMHALRSSPLARLKQEPAQLHFPTRRCAELPLHPQFDHRIEAVGRVGQMTGWPRFLNGSGHSPCRQLNWTPTRSLSPTTSSTRDTYTLLPFRPLHYGWPHYGHWPGKDWFIARSGVPSNI